MSSSDERELRGAPDSLESGAPEQAGRIGPYRILQVLGHGGMGLVYVAEQTEPVRRRVALKIIKAGMDTREVVARFGAERQALAVMEHPNIAKVLDAGTTDAGRPYFVMELVKGLPITEYCDAHKLGTRERLALFVHVCEAVQHAHHKGVIHRDLKPSNVLVMERDGLAVPKVIDFGIAKALSQPLTEHTLVTQVGQAIGTAAYMSPEQASPAGLDVDTRTDIYSLGVMLYELLVGRLPIDPGDMGLALFMVRLASREGNPTTPSAKLSGLGLAAHTVSAQRRTDVRGLRNELKGDIDWIVMKALDADRAHRYETANGFAMDIKRCLNNEPVVARPHTARYRMTKFARRNRSAVLAAVLVVASLMVGLAVAGVQLVRARRAEAVAKREAQSAREVAGFVTGLFKVSDPSEARGNSVTAREILDRGAQRIGAELASEPQVQARLMLTMGTVYRSLGLYAQAQPLLEDALANHRRLLAADDPKLLESELELARLAQQQGRFAVAESLFRSSLAVSERRAAPDRAETVMILTGLGGMLVTRGRYTDAESLLTRAVQMRTASETPDDVDFARLLRNLGSAYLAQGRYADAEPVFERALAMFTRVVGADHPDVGRTLSNLGIVHYELGRFGDAEGYYRRAEENLVKTLGPDHRNVASININLGEIAWRGGRTGEAQARLEKALGILRKGVDANDPSIATAEYDLGNVVRDSGRPGEAVAHYQRALDIRVAGLGAQSPKVAEVVKDYAALLRQLKRPVDAARIEAQVSPTSPTAK